MQIKIIKRFVFNKITSLNNNCNIVDVLTLLDDYLLEVEKKILNSKSDKVSQTQIKLKEVTCDLIQILENLTDKGIISYKMSPYKISNFIKLIDKINGSKEEYQADIQAKKLTNMI